MKEKPPIFSLLSVILFTYAVQAAQMEGALVPRSDHSPPKGFKHYIEYPKDVIELDDATRVIVLKRIKDYRAMQEDLEQTVLSMQRQHQLGRTSGGGIWACIRSVLCLGIPCLDGEEVYSLSRKPGDLPPPSRLSRLLGRGSTSPADGAVEDRPSRTSVRSPLKEKGSLGDDNDQDFVEIAKPGGVKSEWGVGLASFRDELYMAYQGISDDPFGNGGIYIARSSDGCTWRTILHDDSVNRISGGGVGLASFRGALFSAFGRREANKAIWVGVLDSQGYWDKFPAASDWTAVGGVSLATFNGRLYMAYQGTGTPAGRIYLAESTTGYDWVDIGNVHGWTTHWEIGLAAFKDELYMAYQGTGSGGVYVARSQDARTWEKVVHKKHWTASGGIGLTSFNNKLYMAYQGNNDRMYISHSEDGENWSRGFSPDDWSAAYTIGLGTFSTVGDYAESVEQLYMAYRGTGAGPNRRIYVAKYFSPLFLDVWGEGRIVTDITTGFFQSSNLNKRGKAISNGPNERKPIPGLVPVDDYDNPEFPIGDNIVRYMTVMGSPINSETASEMKRVLNKDSSVVILYDPDTASKRRFEDASGLTATACELGYPFDEIKLRDSIYYVYFYGTPRPYVSLPSGERELEKKSIMAD